MQILSTPSFNKDVSKIKDRKIAVQIEQIITKIQSAKSISEIGGIKKLSGSPNSYRIRIAEYRLGFTLTGDTVKLIIFAHRKDIYRYFP